MIKIAVTGASGHIGNCLVRELINKGMHVRVLLHDFENDLGQMDVEMISGNILDVESLKTLCKGVEVVFHLAAIISLDNRHQNKIFDVNVKGTKNLIEAAKSAGVKKFVHFSSIDAMQVTPEDSVFDERILLTESKESIYAFTKAESERLVLNAVREDFEVIILSPTAVIGPFDFRGSFLGQPLIKIYQNKLPMLISGGYNWVDVRDVAAAAIQAMETGRNGEKYILSGNFCSLKDLSELTGKISGKRTPKFIAPIFLAQMASPFYQFYYSLTGKKPIYTWQSLKLLKSAPKNISSEKAQKELGYKPRALEQTLRDTFNWYKQNKYLN
jgi:dihydroflavonol-4-reductase